MNSEMEQALGPVGEAAVVNSERVTPQDRDEVRRIRLRVEDPAFRFSPGQMIGVLVPGPHPFGNRHHLRRYSIASAPEGNAGDGVEFDLLVRRCFYLDEFSGEQYPGIASNYLCDAAPGQRLTIAGPYRSPFRVPADDTSNLVMIGSGTGIAPFRAFVQAIYRQHGGWRGQVRLFYGARSGMDQLYLNDPEGDLANYYDEASFKAFAGILSRPLASEAELLDAALAGHADDVWQLMQAPNTHLYLAGLTRVAAAFDRVMANTAASAADWNAQRARMQAEGRWSELLYS
jgi:ferredoxin--NADP+ reductase